MTRGIHGCPTSDDPMHHSLAKRKRSSQKRPLPATKTKDNFQVQFHSQGASDVPKQKKFRRLFDLTPTRTLLSSKPGDLQVERRVCTSQGGGLKSRGPSQASSSSIPHTTDNDRHQEGPSRASSLPNFDAGVLENESRRSQASRQVSPSPENGEHSPAGSNTPAEHNAESGAPWFVKRGITRMLKALAQQPVQNLLPRVGVFNKEFIGPYASELIASLGVWTRQRENFPLSICLFRKMPPENVERVSQKARDHYELVPDDEVTKTMLRKYMNKAYVSYRASLSTHFREMCKGDLQIALAHPPENCENIEDWKNICEYFNTPEAKARSAKAIAEREKQVLNHTNGSQSFTRKLFERKLKGLAIDPLTMFKETHREKKAKLPQICKQWMKEIDDLLEQKERGEIDFSHEEIYHQVVDSTRLGCKRRRKKAALPANYSKTDEQLTAVQQQLDAANKKITKLFKLLNVTLQNIGQDPVLEDAMDVTENGEKEDEEEQLEDQDDVCSEEEEEMSSDEENTDDEELGGGQ